MLKKYLFIFVAFLSTSLSAQVSKDCVDAVAICSNKVITEKLNGYGADDFNGALRSGCLFGKGYTNSGKIESHSAWYKFKFLEEGDFGITIKPTNPADEYDFALYGPNISCGNFGDPVRCNFEEAKGTGETGFGGSTDAQFDSHGYLHVKAGETYYLLINDIDVAGATSGFSLSFTGTLFQSGANPLDCSISKTVEECEGNTLTLDATTNGASAYKWYKDNVLISNTLPTLDVVAPNAIYKADIINNVGDVWITKTFNVVFNQRPVVTPQTVSYCKGSTIPSFTVNLANTTFKWYNSATSTTVLATGNNFQPPSAGVYYVEPTSDKGCTGNRVAMTMTETTVAMVDVLVDKPQIFIGQTAQFNTNNTYTTYNWTGVNGFSSNLKNPTLAVDNLNDAGTYSVTVTDGCSASDNVALTVYDNVENTLGADVKTCIGGSVTKSYPAISGFTYLWTKPDGTTATTNSLVLNQAGNYTLKVTTSDGNSSSGTINFGFYNKPVINANQFSKTYCKGSTIPTLSVDLTGATFKWYETLTSTTVLSSTNTYTPTQAETYYVQATTPEGCIGDREPISLTETTVAAVDGLVDKPQIFIGQTAQFNTNNTYTTYNWTGVNGFSSTLKNPTLNIDNLNDAGTYSVTVTDGCSASDNVTLTVYDNVENTLGADVKTCIGGSVTKSYPAISGFTYLWTKPDGTTTTTNSLVLNQAGNYTLKVTTPDGNSSSGTIIFGFYDKPVINANQFSKTYCKGSTIPTLAVNLTGATFKWYETLTSTTVLSGTNTYTPTQAGTYYVQATTPEGCIGDREPISLTETTVAAVDALVDKLQIFIGQTAQFNTNNTYTTYNWTGVNGFSSTIKNPTLNIDNLNDAGTYSVIVTDGCSASDNVALTVYDNVENTLGADVKTCIGGSVTKSYPAISGFTYLWTKPDGTTATTNSLVLNQAGNYTLKVTTPDGNSNSGTITFGFYDKPILNVSDVSYCESESIPALTVSLAGATFNWYDSATSTTVLATGNSYKPNNPGTYYVQATSAEGCLSDRYAIKLSKIDLATVPVTANYTQLFIGQNLDLSVENSQSYKWTGSNNFSSTLQNPSVLIDNLNDAGTYSVVATKASACPVKGSTNIQVYQDVQSVIGTQLALCDSSDSQTIEYPLVTGFQYVWTLPDGSQSNTNTITVMQTGNYTLKVTTSEGNTDEGTLSVQITDLQITKATTCFGQTFVEATGGSGNYEYSIDGINYQVSPIFTNTNGGTIRRVYVRDVVRGCVRYFDDISTTVTTLFNAFSPNGDGINDTWDLSNFKACRNIEVFIFDRYGRKITQLNANKLQWDGTVNGKPVPSDTYWYAIDFKDGVTPVIKSHITIKRNQ